MEIVSGCETTGNNTKKCLRNATKQKQETERDRGAKRNGKDRPWGRLLQRLETSERTKQIKQRVRYRKRASARKERLKCQGRCSKVGKKSQDSRSDLWEDRKIRPMGKPDILESRLSLIHSSDFLWGGRWWSLLWLFVLWHSISLGPPPSAAVTPLLLHRNPMVLWKRAWVSFRFYFSFPQL